MAVQILNLINTALSSCGQYFSTLLQKSGMVGIFFSMLFIFFLSKYILHPLVGRMYGKSDQARKSSGDVDE